MKRALARIALAAMFPKRLRPKRGSNIKKQGV